MLCQQVGFPRRSQKKLQLALQNTHMVLWVRATKQTRWARRGQLLGFARATSDHALFGTIWDVAVGALPSAQRRTHVHSRWTSKPNQHITRIACLCDTSVSLALTLRTAAGEPSMAAIRHWPWGSGAADVHAAR